MSLLPTDGLIYPPEFASQVAARWSEQDQERQPLPDLATLIGILEVAYQASFLTEEGEPIRCRVILADPDDWQEGESPPSGFHVLKFAQPIPYTPLEIRKLSGAASYFRALIAIHIHPKLGAQIWGIVESGARWLNRVEGGRFDGTPLPPHFVIHILGVGNLLTACGYQRHLELDEGQILLKGFDPFKSTWLAEYFAPVRQWLDARIEEKQLSGATVSECFIRTMAQSVIRRTISLIRTRGHGGMLLNLPTQFVESPRLHGILRIRCPFEANSSTKHFPELMLKAMHRMSQVGALHGHSNVVWKDYQAIHDSSLTEVEESFSEMSHLLADLMSVDGALVISNRFELIGFGAEILGDEHVHEVFRALDLDASSLRSERADSSGTRHRSAYRLLHLVPDALALVISQDGGVRFVANRSKKVTYWPYLP